MYYSDEVFKEFMFCDEILVPLCYMPGKFEINNMCDTDENALKILYSYRSNMYTYDHPLTGQQVIKHIKTEDSEFRLFATYNEDSKLKYLELCGDDYKPGLLLFIGYENIKEAKAAVFDFAKHSGKMISQTLLQRNEKFARLFLESYYDVDLFGFEIMYYDVQSGAPEDMHMLLENPEKHHKAIDNDYNYPLNNRIFCDVGTLEILLRCAPKEVSEELFEIYSSTITGIIKSKVVDKLDKTDDFKLIVTNSRYASRDN
ncbi:hypothetical protein [Ruminococcus albus]|uniref:hypothetical protein n=1 Tax=Ruminococcus albus TaxID=1264 RepID=UPI000464C608|nr:hypothetical protein [Ruminococcus albus]